MMANAICDVCWGITYNGCLMQYTVWSRGELIGETDLGFRGLGFDQGRSGDFHPNNRGRELLPVLKCDSHCMRAYMHRNFRDADGNGILDPEYVGSDWFADIAEHLHRTAEYALELRDANNAIIATSEIGIQDKHPEWKFPDRTDDSPRLPDPASDLANWDHPLLHKQRPELLPHEARQLREQFDQQMAEENAQELIDELIANDSLLIEGMEYDSIPCDITTPVGWGYEETLGDNELGSGWCSKLRDVPDFPRYQIHVILEPLPERIDTIRTGP